MPPLLPGEGVLMGLSGVSLRYFGYYVGPEFPLPSSLPLQRWLLEGLPS